jgi:hypothetical protein
MCVWRSVCFLLLIGVFNVSSRLGSYAHLDAYLCVVSQLNTAHHVCNCKSLGPTQMLQRDTEGKGRKGKETSRKPKSTRIEQSRSSSTGRHNTQHRRAKPRRSTQQPEHRKATPIHRTIQNQKGPQRPNAQTPNGNPCQLHKTAKHAGQ